MKPEEIKQRREEIREGVEVPIRRELVKYPELDNEAVLRKAREIAGEIEANLHSQGVVIADESEELPKNPLASTPNLYTKAQQDMRKAGWRPTHKLVEE